MPTGFFKISTDLASDSTLFEYCGLLQITNIAVYDHANLIA